MAEREYLELNKVRAHKVKALVGTGTTMLVLPEDLVDSLGLKRYEKVVVTYVMNGKKRETPLIKMK